MPQVTDRHLLNETFGGCSLVQKTHEEHPSSVRRHRKQLSQAATCDRIAANQDRRRIVRR